MTPSVCPYLYSAKLVHREFQNNKLIESDRLRHKFENPQASYICLYVLIAVFLCVISVFSVIFNFSLSWSVQCAILDVKQIVMFSPIESMDRRTNENVERKVFTKRVIKAFGGAI